MKQKNGRSLPEEHSCHFRESLRKGLWQPLHRDDPIVWHIDNGKYLAPAIQDIKRALLETGLPWFDQFENLDHVFELLQQIREKMSLHFNKEWISPEWAYKAGYVALRLNKWELAIEYLSAVLDSGCYGSQVQLSNDIENAKDNLNAQHL